jgi:hypothetical protein
MKSIVCIGTVVALLVPLVSTAFAQADTSPPQLTSFGFVPTSIDTTAGPVNLTVNFTVTDDLSGVTDVAVFFFSPSGGQSVGNSISFPATTNGTGSLTLTFPQFAEAGTWIASHIALYDAVGNPLNLYPVDIAALGFPTELVVTTEPPVVEVEIDILPGSSRNSINPTKKGVIPVAILSTDAFDATTVDPSTVRFGTSGAPPAFALDDVDDDGDVDMLLRFRTQAVGITCGMTSVSLTGQTLAGQAIEGADSIKTPGCKSVNPHHSGPDNHGKKTGRRHSRSRERSDTD